MPEYHSVYRAQGSGSKRAIKKVPFVSVPFSDAAWQYPSIQALN